MGLCKCPKKKVTNLFCFEHRVNVCEHCLTANHERCIVQSYLQWLQDSDYDPTCRLCGKNLGDESCGACVRLSCYDVFHWSCLDSYARQLPANTAPAGYTCPICNSCVFPAANVASPVAESLRKTLVQVNWARAGLGLPLSLDNLLNPIEEPSTSAPSTAPAPQQSITAAAAPTVHSSLPPRPPTDGSYAQQVAAEAMQQHSVVSMDESTPYTRVTDKSDFNPRKLFDSTKGESLLNVSHDHDEDKYKRRPALQWFVRWYNSYAGKKTSDPNASLKKFAVILVIAIVGFLTIVMIMTRVGRASADNDPFLDPLANPNIRVEGN